MSAALAIMSRAIRSSTTAPIRDYQTRTPQWMVGKNFDGTGAFGPVFVTADELPAGCKGLRLTTRLNGETVQKAMIDDDGVRRRLARIARSATR